MVIGGVANVYFHAAVNSPSTVAAAVSAVHASRPDLTESQLSGQIAQQLAKQQRASVIATPGDVTGVADSGALDIYA